LLVLVADDDTCAWRAADRLALVAGTEPRGQHVLVRVAGISAARPTVPEGGSDVLVVLSAGMRTGWELAGITQACADAGHELAGGILAHRARPLAPNRMPPRGESFPVNGKAMAGSS
jgi:hypothetical protein